MYLRICWDLEIRSKIIIIQIYIKYMIFVISSDLFIEMFREIFDMFKGWMTKSFSSQITSSVSNRFANSRH